MATMKLPGKVDLVALAKAPVALDFVLPGLKLGTVGALISPGGTGKSYWTLNAAVAIAGGLAADLTGLAPKQGRVLVLSAEDDEDVLALRLQAVMACLPADADLSLLDYRICRGMNIDLMNDDWRRALRQEAQGARLVVLDTLRRFHNLDENSSQDMNRLMGVLEDLAQETNASVLYLHHTSKAAALNGQGGAQQAARGSSVLVDNPRWSAFLAVMSEQECRRFHIPLEERLLYVRWNVSKQNYGEPIPDRWYKRGEGGVLLQVTLTPRHDGSEAGPDNGDCLPDAPAPAAVNHPEPETINTKVMEPAAAAVGTANNAFNGNW